VEDKEADMPHTRPAGDIRIPVAEGMQDPGDMSLAAGIAEDQDMT